MNGQSSLFLWFNNSFHQFKDKIPASTEMQEEKKKKMEHLIIIKKLI